MPPRRFISCGKLTNTQSLPRSHLPGSLQGNPFPCLPTCHWTNTKCQTASGQQRVRCQTGREAASLRLEPGEYGLTSVLNGWISRWGCMLTPKTSAWVSVTVQGMLRFPCNYWRSTTTKNQEKKQGKGKKNKTENNTKIESNSMLFCRCKSVNHI